MIIVIDGPAGSGKSTTAQALSKQLGINFLDSGALYRALTLAWIEAGKIDKDQFFNNLSEISIDAAPGNSHFEVWLNGENISDKIRSQTVADNVSDIATDKRARAYVNQIMRKLVEKDTYIADGRDLGTAVFPDADLKFFMEASAEERAKRRHAELVQKGEDVSYDEVLQNLEKRDHTDRNRSSDPLKKADDAILIDTTGKTFEEQVDEISSIIKRRLTI